MSRSHTRRRKRGSMAGKLLRIIKEDGWDMSRVGPYIQRMKKHYAAATKGEAR